LADRFPANSVLAKRIYVGPQYGTASVNDPIRYRSLLPTLRTLEDAVAYSNAGVAYEYSWAGEQLRRLAIRRAAK